MRYGLIVLWMLLGSVTSAMAQVSVGIGLPGVSIGINVPLYPELVPVPGYPVYYAPGMNSNYFFYDGMYWVYRGDNWYASSWYNGPWGLVGPEVVPLFVLRIPVRYYRDPPGYFRGWRSDAPPRWGQHWGNAWEQRRSGWDHWNRRSAPAAAPLPVYQRQYSGDRYPRAEQQHALQGQNYRYQPRDAVVRQHVQAQAAQRAPAPLRQGAPAVPRAQSPQRGGEAVQRAAPMQGTPQQRGPAVQDRRQQVQPEQGPAQVQRQPQPQQGPVQGQRQPQPQQGLVQGQRQAPQPQQGAVQRGQQMPRSGPENSPQAKGAPQAPGRGQENARQKGEERNK